MRYLQAFVALLAIAGSTMAQELTLQQSGTELVVNANGLTAMTALQFNLELPDGVTITDSDATTGDATDGHTLCIETLASGDHMFILYSMNLDTFRDGELLRIPVNINEDGIVKLCNVRFADTEAMSYAGEETATGISSPQIVNSKSSKGNCFDLSGRQIVNSKSSNSKLQKGIYIIDGRKVVK